jgi:glycosyltransferase involved in cell wall biosynthesis
MPELSVVIPIYNEAPNLERLYDEFTAALEGWGRPYELILVDDGSVDGSIDILEQLAARDARVRVIEFRRNFGQTAAFAAGFAAARGGLIATADGDLQNDPRDLPAMIQRLESGHDIICGWRQHRKDPFLNRRLPSIVANWLISRSTGVRLNDYGCSLKVFRAEVVKPLRLYGEMHRFLPALASEMGVRIAEQTVNHRPRVQGRSKYGISRTVRVILDLLTVKFLLSYATRPLQIFGLLGLVLGGLGALILGVLGFGRIMQQVSLDQHQPMVLLGILLGFAGLQLLTIGLLAEMQVRTYHESQGKPTYVIRRVIAREAPEAPATSPSDATRAPSEPLPHARR